MNEYDLLKQLDNQNIDTSVILRTHTEFLISLGKKIDTIGQKIDAMETVSIINGNADGTPTQYSRNDFFQMLYDKTNPLKQMEKFNRTFDTIKKFIIIIITLTYLIISFISYTRLDSQQKQIEQTLQEIRK
ncbi:MAG: hypothetical protein AB1695_12700 [Stygiobacter sp.]